MKLSRLRGRKNVWHSNLQMPARFEIGHCPWKQQVLSKITWNAYWIIILSEEKKNTDLDAISSTSPAVEIQEWRNHFGLQDQPFTRNDARDVETVNPLQDTEHLCSVEI